MRYLVDLGLQERLIALPPVKRKAEVAAEQQGSQSGDKEGSPKANGKAQISPFTVVQASMGWETFHMLHKTWLDAINTPPSSPEKDWEMQVLPVSILVRVVLSCMLPFARRMTQVSSNQVNAF